MIEPSLGVERLFLAIMSSAYTVETLDNGEERINLKLQPHLAPYNVAILPLIKKYHKEKALEVQSHLAKYFMTTYDESGKIGRRHRIGLRTLAGKVGTNAGDALWNDTILLR